MPSRESAWAKRSQTHHAASRPATTSLIDQFASIDDLGFDHANPEQSARRRLDALIQQLFDTTPQSSVALGVLQATADDRIDTPRLAALIELDPFLALRVLRLANTAYYGLQQQVATVRLAVSIIGFSAVRALAAMVAMGITEAQVPPRFLSHSAQVAVGASRCALLLDDPIGDAFSGGLLHDVGEALLYRCAPGLWQITQDSKNPLDAQVRTFGMNHQRAGHLVLQAWQLPDRLLDAVGRHHEGFDSAPPVARSVACAEAVVEKDFVTAASYGLSFDDIEQMQVDIQDEAAALHAWLQNR